MRAEIIRQTLKRRARRLCKTLCLAWAGTVTVAAACPALAQSVIHSQTRDKLAAHVQLELGATTVKRMTAALAAQTGLDIQAAPYLNAHQITVQITDASGEDALNTLAELNGWRWYEKQDGSIVLSHLRVTTPQQITAIPAMLQAAVPADIRRYLQTDRSSLPGAAPMTFVPQNGSLSGFGDVNRRTLSLGNELARLLPDIANGTPVPYQHLTPNQQRTLLSCLFLGGTAGFSGIMGEGLMRGSFDPFELDVTKSEVTLHNGKTLYIGSKTIEGTLLHKAGFAASIHYGERRGSAIGGPRQ